MPSHPASAAYRLVFLLPEGTQAGSGRHQPSPQGCRLHLTWPLVEIDGPSREAVFDHAARLLRTCCRGKPALSIGAILHTPILPASRDGWSIIVGADIAFSPARVDPYLPGAAEARPPPRDPPAARGRA